MDYSNPTAIAEYHKRQGRIEASKKPLLHFVCLDCGKEFDEPQPFKSCDSCNALWKSGYIHHVCQKCDNPKTPSREGLCTECFKIASKRNSIRNEEHYKRLQEDAEWELRCEEAIANARAGK